MISRLTLTLSLPLACALLTGSGTDPLSPREILEKMVEELVKHESMTCEVLYRMKYFSRDDTLEYRATVDKVRAREDTVFGGYVRYSVGDTIETFYDLDLIYSTWHSYKTVRTFKAHEGETFGITGNTTGGVIRLPFLKLDGETDVLDEAETVEVIEENLNGRACWKIVVNYPEEDGFSEGRDIYWIDKENFLLLKKTYRIRFQGNYQYNEWSVSNIRFDEITAGEMVAANSRYLEDYEVTPFEREEAQQEMELLADGTVAPDFTGRRYGDDAEMQLAGSGAKLILLDFWYMSCYPCIQAIPHMQALYEKYADKGLTVWGVNSADRDESRRKKLPKFLEHNRMSYPIVFTDRSVDSSYNVQAYPSLYVLNEKREVLFSSIGYSDDLEERLEEVIVRNLEGER